MDCIYSKQQREAKKRTKMGNENAKPVDKLKFIDREVNSMRSSVRSTRRTIPSQTKEEYIHVLARFSSEAGELKGKVKSKYLEQTQKNISNAVNEILTKVPASPETDLDMGAIETSSFIEVPVNKRQASNKGVSSKPPKKQKSSQIDSIKRNTTLLDIEEKLKTLKPQINIAIENKDTTMLRLHQETIKVLAGDLEMIELTEDTPIADKKKKLEGNITTQFKKITKALMDIRRGRDINYLAKQAKREKAMKELEEIKRNLEETNAVLKVALKNNDSSSLSSIQERLIAINHRLSSVEAVDETTTKKKIELMNQFKGIYEDINNTPKNNSQSDLSKAQSNYEDIVRNIASGQNKDKEDIKIKLHSLQSFINNIKEDDAESLKRKEQLLNNVRQSFSFILDERRSETGTGSIPKKANTSYKELDNFYNNWKSVQKVVKSSTYSVEEVAKIDKILRDIQNSIGHTRQQISGIANEQTNIKTKLNYSTPNLSSSKARPNYESSLSLDHSGQLIKTRAKVYNLSTPEIRNINDQPVVLRNKKFYKNYEFDDGYRFSKIEEIKTQVNYIKEKFSESQQKQHLKNKLESYVEILDEYVHHKNQTTASNARIVLSDIQEMLKNMSHIQDSMNTAQRRMSVEDSLENIAGVQVAVDKIQKDIDDFSGTKDDEEYTKMKEGLLECRQCLEDTKVPPKYEMIQQQKEQILEKINNLLKTLDNIDFFDDSHIAGIEEAVNKLQNSIVMFSGRKGDNEYTKIRDSLIECRNCLEDSIIPDKYVMIQKQKDDILKKIPHLFATLEIKSSNHQEDPVLILTRRNLANLKERVRAFTGAYKGVLYNKLEKELNKLLLDVGDTIHDKTAVDEIVKDVEKHLKILEQRSTQDQSFRRTLSGSNARHEEEDKLVKLKNDLTSIRSEIDSTPSNAVNLFVGLKSRLDLVKLGLDQLRIMSEDDEKQKEVLYGEVETYRSIVEAKISLSKQAIRQYPELDKAKRHEEEMNKIEEKFRTLKPEIENFVGTTSDNKFYELDETSIRLVLRMDKLQFTKGSDIYNRKINLLKEIYGYGDLLDQRAKETEDIIEIEREVHDLEMNFERFLRLNDLENLQDKLDKLQEKIYNTETNRNLLERKQRCATKIKALADKLKETKEKSNKEVVIIERDTRRISRDPTNEISELERRFNYFKKEIEQFVGIHTDRKYYELDGSISVLFSKLDSIQLPEQGELHARKLKLLKEMQVYSNILDQRAKEVEILREIVKQLNAINAKVDNYKGSNEELKVMETELKAVQSKLKTSKISDTHRRTLEQKYDILFGEYKRLMKAKEVPKNSYIGSTSFLEDVQNLNKTKASVSKQEDSVYSQISEIQREIDEIRGQVEIFASSDTSEEYKKIEESLLLLNVRVNKLDIPKGDRLYQRKLELDKKIQLCFMVLDERAQEADSLMDIEKEIEELSKKFDGIMSESEKNSIDEKLISLQVKLGKLHVGDDLNQRKNMCTNRIIIYSKQLKDLSSSPPHSNPEEEP